VIAKKALLAVLAAAVLALPYHEPALFPLAWFAFVPLFWVIDHVATPRQAFLFGWLAGSAAHVFGFHWLTYTITVFGGFPFAVSVLVFALYAALQGLQMALFTLALKTIGRGPLSIFAALFWVCAEFSFPLLFPWHLANSQIAFLWLVQTADLVGPYGASFVVMWFNAALYWACFAPITERKARFWPLAYASLFAVLSVVYGILRLQSVSEEMASARKLSVAAVQGNVDIDMKWNPVLAQQNLNKHRDLTNSAPAAQLVIWPESAIEAMFADSVRALPLEFLPAFKEERGYFIFGAKSFRGHPGQADSKAFNTAFFTDAKGRILGRYHKQVLLAFGEYLPFAKILSWIPAMPFADGFTAGPGPIAFPLQRGIRVGPLICYEDLMPDLARSLVSETRANVLVNITNDAWYGKSVGPWQHLRLSQSRAIETRRSLLRVTNTGVTSLVNAKGELVKILPMFTAAVMQTEVDILNDETYYVRFGDWFAWGAALLSFALCGFYLKRYLAP
jgi:apolipoprotein N-acyltransferase